MTDESMNQNTNSTKISYFDSALISQMEEYIELNQYNMVLLELSNINRPNIKNAILDLIDVDIHRCLNDADYDNLETILSVFRLYLREQILSEIAGFVLSSGSFSKIAMSGDLMDPPFKIEDVQFIDGDKKRELLYLLPDPRIYDRASILIIKRNKKFYLMKCRGLTRKTANQLIEGQYLYYKKYDIHYQDLDSLCDSLSHKRVIFDLG